MTENFRRNARLPKKSEKLKCEKDEAAAAREARLKLQPNDVVRVPPTAISNAISPSSASDSVSGKRR